MAGHENKDLQKRLLAQINLAQKSMAALDQEITVIAGTRLFVSNEGKALLALHRRLIETLVHGEPKTKLPARHHE